MVRKWLEDGTVFGTWESASQLVILQRPQSTKNPGCELQVQDKAVRIQTTESQHVLWIFCRYVLLKFICSYRFDSESPVGCSASHIVWLGHTTRAILRGLLNRVTLSWPISLCSGVIVSCVIPVWRWYLNKHQLRYLSHKNDSDVSNVLQYLYDSLLHMKCRGIDSVIVNFGRIVAPSVFGSSLREVQSLRS